MDRDWLPVGTHHGLVITHRPTGRGNWYTPAEWKGVIHDTEGFDFHAMSNALVGEKAESHVLLGLVGHTFHVEQFIPLGMASLALEHPTGTPQTNNAHCVQIEVCQKAIVRGSQDRPDWSDETYDALAKLALMIENRVPIARQRPRKFSSHPHRFTPAGFQAVKGWIGHEHVPSQPKGHWDPGAFDGAKLIRRMKHFAPYVKPH